MNTADSVHFYSRPSPSMRTDLCKAAGLRGCELKCYYNNHFSFLGRTFPTPHF
jgi:hypothetical protein